MVCHMKKNKKEINLEVLVGIFIFIILITLGVFTIVLGGSAILKNQYSYEVVFKDIGGLQDGDGVFLRGKKIGYVKDTILKPDSVYVYLSLDIPVDFYQGYRIDVAHASMLGGKVLNIDLGRTNTSPLPHDYLLKGTQSIDVMEDFNLAVHNMKKILDVIINQEGALGKLIFDDMIYLELKNLASQSTSILDKIESGEGTIGKLLINDSLYNDTKQLVSGFNMVTERVVNGEGALGQLLSEDNTVIDDLQEAANELSIAMTKLNSTNGTIGKLLNDPELYDEGTKIIDDVRKSPLRFLIRDQGNK